jgi:hypothetical protein
LNAAAGDQGELGTEEQRLAFLDWPPEADGQPSDFEATQASKGASPSLHASPGLDLCQRFAAFHKRDDVVEFLFFDLPQKFTNPRPYQCVG